MSTGVTSSCLTPPTWVASSGNSVLATGLGPWGDVHQQTTSLIANIAFNAASTGNYTTFRFIPTSGSYAGNFIVGCPLCNTTYTYGTYNNFTIACSSSSSIDLSTCQKVTGTASYYIAVPQPGNWTFNVTACAIQTFVFESYTIDPMKDYCVTSNVSVVVRMGLLLFFSSEQTVHNLFCFFFSSLFTCFRDVVSKWHSHWATVKWKCHQQCTVCWLLIHSAGHHKSSHHWPGEYQSLLPGLAHPKHRRCLRPLHLR